jgi:16S rRNA C1402 N4-methylase RsmH
LDVGDHAIDATVGNGHDTLFLSEQVGMAGKVFGFDIQQQAIDATLSKLESNHSFNNTQLFQISHSKMKHYIPTQYHRKIKVIMFNLGYLPGSDKTVITSADSTLLALNQSVSLLAPSGIIAIIAYPGHQGGDEETRQIKEWCHRLSTEQYTDQTFYSSDKKTAPILFIIQKAAIKFKITDTINVPI